MPRLTKREVTGKRQSPIDLDHCLDDGTCRLKSFGSSSISVDYSAVTGAEGLTLENTGHGWKLNIPDQVAQQCPISGGPLGADRYRLLQVHAHWGPDASSGSEHTVKGRQFPCEVHLVHWNADKYSSPAEAMECTEDGLAVIGVFFELGEESGPLSKIVSHLPEIACKGMSTPFDASDLDLNLFLPSNSNFFSYEGSLTTPPYSESVIWIVMEEPISASEEQIACFRAMNNAPAGAQEALCQSNWRPVQDLHSRSVAYFTFA